MEEGAVMSDSAKIARTQRECADSVVLAMLASLPSDWDGPGSFMPDERCVERAIEAERTLTAGAHVFLRVLPMPVGGISLSWVANGIERVVNIENVDPLMETYSASYVEGGLLDYHEILDASELVSVEI